METEDGLDSGKRRGAMRQLADREKWRALLARLLSHSPWLEQVAWPRAAGFLHAARLCLFMGLSNLTQNRVRFLVAVAGAAVPILLLTLQMAFLGAVREKVSKLYDTFDFDIAVISDSYQFLFSSGNFDRVRLSEARAVPGVADTFGLNIDSTRWANLVSGQFLPVILIGLDDPRGFVRDPAIRGGLSLLTSGRDILVDSYSSPELGALAPGTEAQLGSQTVQVAGQFTLGLFFYADGSVIVPNTYFSQFSLHDPGNISVGFIKLTPDADPGRVRAALRDALPHDVRVLTRSQLLDSEENFFLSTKPIGITFRISMLIAFVVGTVILLQVLSVEIVNRMSEFATMKAMGFSPAFVLGVGLTETVGLAVAAFLAALAVGTVILGAVEWTTHLATAVTLGLAATVLLIVLAMCLASAFAVIRRIWQADAAELY